jgi:hypothetical protein
MLLQCRKTALQPNVSGWLNCAYRRFGGTLYLQLQGWQIKSRLELKRCVCKSRCEWADSVLIGPLLGWQCLDSYLVGLIVSWLVPRWADSGLIGPCLGWQCLDWSLFGLVVSWLVPIWADSVLMGPLFGRQCLATWLIYCIVLVFVTGVKIGR